MTRSPLTDQEWDRLLDFLGDPPAISTWWATARVEAGRAGMTGLDPDRVLTALDYKASKLAASQAFYFRGYVKVPGPAAAGQWSAGPRTHTVYAKSSLSEGERLDAVDQVLADLGGRPRPYPEDPRTDEKTDAAARRHGFRLDGLVDPADLDPRHVVTLPAADRPYFVAFRPLDPADPRVLVADGRSLDRALRRGLDLVAMVARVDGERGLMADDPYNTNSRHLPLRRAS